ncbi:MAG: DUF2203 domain-containing protein [Planctomycetales bacterium]|nr:DUF2203 domain-containing protein [Planctomycetales bacterium]
MAHTYQPAKLFTPEQANAMLPLVRAIVADLVALSRDVVERRQRLANVTGGRELDGDDPYAEELVAAERDLDRDAMKIREFAKELEELGVELKDPLVGLVDFPCERDGRTIYLCWKHGEPQVDFWHELDAGFQGRRSLPL